jgi:hypothetical protein
VLELASEVLDMATGEELTIASGVFETIIEELGLASGVLETAMEELMTGSGVLETAIEEELAIASGVLETIANDELTTTASGVLDATTGIELEDKTTLDGVGLDCGFEEPDTTSEDEMAEEDATEDDAIEEVLANASLVLDMLSEEVTEDAPTVGDGTMISKLTEGLAPISLLLATLLATTAPDVATGITAATEDEELPQKATPAGGATTTSATSSMLNTGKVLALVKSAAVALILSL